MTRTHGPAAKDILKVGLGLFLCAQMALVSAQNTGSSTEAENQIAGVNSAGSADGPEYGGIVTSLVSTSLGHSFHSKFTEAWNTQSDAQAYVLLIREFYSPRFGTEVRVVHDGLIVYRKVLPRNLDAVLELGRSAAEEVHDRLVQIKIQAALFNDADLAKSGY